MECRSVGADAHIGPCTCYEFAVVRYKTGISPRGDVGIAPYGWAIPGTLHH